MSFPVIHGLKLASGSSIENFVLENLAADPDSGSLTVGRMWFNTTDKKLRMAAIDGGGAMKVQDVPLEDEVQVIRSNVWALEDDTLYADGRRAMSGDLDMGTTNAITNLADPVNDQDAANKRYVDGKIGALGNAFEYVGTVDPTADANLDNLAQKDAGDFYRVIAAGTVTWASGANSLVVNAGDSLVWNPSGNVDKLDNTNSEVFGTSGEIIVTGSTDNGFNVSIDPAYTTTINNSNTAAVDAQNELDASQVAIGINDDGSYSPVAGANYISTATTVKQATQQLDTQAKVNADGLAAETTARQTADTNLTNSLATEVSDRQAADTTLTTNLNTEISDRQTADTALQTEITRVENKGRTESSNYAAVLNSRMFNFESTGAATTHTINHNLGTSNLISSIYVYDPDSLAWQKDLVSEVATDGNNYTVELSVARQIRAVLMSVESIADADWTTA